jgi:hypothetical protein
MITQRTLLAISLFGALVIGAAITAQTRKMTSVTIELQTGKHVINVDSSTACVDLEILPAVPGDTVDFVSSSGNDFHVIFYISPFANLQTYFDKAHHQSGPIAVPSGVLQDFKYVITVDGGKVCDPHVIVIHAKG